MVNLSPKEIDDSNKEQFFRFGAKELPSFFDETGNRICRVIVMEQLHPIFELSNLEHFKHAIRDIVLTYHVLFRSEVQILHRDISLHSLTVRYSDNGAVHGVLIDFDLASVGEPRDAEQHGRQTATRRFMAIDLLKKETPPHLERFGWESFFYVICWIGTHYSNGTEIQTTALKTTWDADDDETLSEVKQSVLFGLSRPNLGILFTDFYKPLVSSWIQDMQSMFLAADQARKKFERAKAANLEEDTFVFHETLGGRVTWDKFWQILEK